MGDKTDEIREKLDDEPMGGTVDDDTGPVLTLDTSGDRESSNTDDSEGRGGDN